MIDGPFVKNAHTIVRRYMLTVSGGTPRPNQSNRPMPDRAATAEERRRLTTLLSPSSVAIVGANDEPRSFGGAPIHNLLRFGYTGAIYAVNPKYQEVQGVRCYPSVLDIPDPVVQAIVAVAARHVVGVLEECATKGV